LTIHPLIDPPEEYLRRQITAIIATQWALDDDRLERKFVDTGRDVPTAFPAGDDECLPNWPPLEHEGSIDEQKANIQAIHDYPYNLGRIGWILWCIPFGVRLQQVTHSIQLEMSIGSVPAINHIAPGIVDFDCKSGA
jgi:hypothetical protein